MTISRVGAVLLVSAFICAGPWASRVAAQEQPLVPVGGGDEVDHEALRQLRAVYERAILDNNIGTLGPLFAPQFFGVMVTGRMVTGLEELKRYWADIHALIGEGGRYTTTLNPERSVIIGDIALARGTSDDVVVTGENREFRFQSFWTAVLQKQAGAWTVLQVQGTIDPVDNPFVREFRRRAIQLTAVIAGLVGLFIGLGGGWFLGKRSRRAATA